MSRERRVLDPCGCCDPAGTPTPLRLDNRPALSSIGYRVGTYGSFRAAMVSEISRRRNLGGWTARSGDDYGIALLEMWAYVADILTFYQERIANEAFLRTAQLPESLLYLARFLDYRPAPGVSAAARLVFTMQRDKETELPPSLRVQSVPDSRDEKPQTFETSHGVHAAAAYNELRLRAIRPGRVLERGAKRTQLAGVATGVEPGDYIVIVGREHVDDPTCERWDVRQVSHVAIDEEHDLTHIEWSPGLGAAWAEVDPAHDVQQLYVFRLRAWPFGYNAPDWELLPPPLKEKEAAFEESWNKANLPQDPNAPTHLFLDDVYEQLLAPGWVALTTPEEVRVKRRKRKGYTELYRVVQADATVRSAYALTGRVTRLVLDAPDGGRPENIEIFPLRGTSVLADAEPLEQVELVEEAAGWTLELDAVLPALRREQRLLLVGESGDEEHTELVVVDDVDVREDHTLVRLTVPLARTYRLDTVRLYGNVADATHGETVEAEVLGSGDAAQTFQRFHLQKSPLTFVTRPGAPQGVAAELEVRVDGVRWHEVPSFYGCGADDRVFITRIDTEGEATVQFGDGVTGARLPTGRNNVVAKYRYGLGRPGNVDAGAVRTLLDRPLGLRAGHNPDPTGIGVDAEPPELTRANVPNTVRTFGRIVSLRDFEDAARENAVVAKARATWEWDGEVQAVHLTVAGEGGVELEGTPLEGLVRDLDARRDPNRKLVVRRHVEVAIEVEAVVHVHPDHLARDVVPAARAALEEYVSFENLQFGQPIHLSDVYRVLQNVEGVLAADVDVLRFRRFEPATAYHRFVRARGGTFTPVGGVEQPDPVQAHLLLHADELAAIDQPGDARVRAA